MAIEFLYFDLGNVLLRFSHQLMCQQIATVLGAQTEQIRALLFDDGWLVELETGRVSGELLHQRLCQQFQSQATLPDLGRAASDIFQLNYSIVPLVTTLADLGYPLGILSNTSRLHWEWVLARPYAFVSELFGHHVLSFEVGAMKPSPWIYQAAAEAAGVAPEKIFYTDDIPKNVEGAKAAGFDAVLYTETPELIAQLQQRGISLG